jgi:hypothetical protein
VKNMVGENQTDEGSLLGPAELADRTGDALDADGGQPICPELAERATVVLPGRGGAGREGAAAMTARGRNPRA